MPRRLLALLLAATALACTEKDTDDEDEDGGDEDEETDGDGPGGGGGGSGACSPIFPVDTARHTLHYEWIDAETGTTGAWSVAYAGADTLDGQAAWRLDGVYETLSEDFESRSWISFWYACDDEGVWVLGNDTEQVSTTSAGTSEYSSQTRYTRPALAAPAQVDVGTTWTQDAEYRIVDDRGNDDIHSSSTNYEITDLAPVDVPAGSFEAYAVQYVINGETYTYWAAEDVGTVRSGGHALVRIEE